MLKRENVPDMMVEVWNLHTAIVCRYASGKNATTIVHTLTCLNKVKYRSKDSVSPRNLTYKKLNFNIKSKRGNHWCVHFVGFVLCTDRKKASITNYNG